MVGVSSEARSLSPLWYRIYLYLYWINIEMVRQYLRTRFTKQTVSDKVLSQVQKVFGELKLFKKTKVLSLNTYVMKNDLLYQLNEGQPQLKD